MADQSTTAMWRLMGRLFLADPSVAVPSLVLGAYVNDIAITDDRVMADLVECSAPHYARQPLSPFSAWTEVLDVAGDVVYWRAELAGFSFAGPGAAPQTVYGHFVSDSGSGTLLWGSRWVVPFPIPPFSGVDSHTPDIHPTLYLQQCVESIED